MMSLVNDDAWSLATNIKSTERSAVKYKAIGCMQRRQSL